MPKKNNVQCLSLVLLLFLVIYQVDAQNSETKPATITVNLKEVVGKMRPVWAWFGHDEPNYTYMKDGKKLLTELAELSPAPVYMRVHSLLTTGDGTPALKWGSTNAYTEDANGNPVYNWNIIDSIFDTYIVSVKKRCTAAPTMFSKHISA